MQHETPHLTQSTRLGLACAVVGLLGVACLGSLPSGFVTADDAMQMLMASGAMTAGQGDARTLYSNVLLMAPLVALFHGWPELNWYSANLVAAHLLASLTLVYIVLGGRSLRWALVFMTLLVVGFDLTFLVNLQFTHAAAAAATAGLALLFVGTRHEERATAELWCGVALAFYGSLIRVDGFLLALLLFAPAYGARALSRGIRALAWPAITITLVIGALGIDRLAYASDRSWMEFLDFRPQMLRLFNDPKGIDGGPALDEALAHVGWSVNDWRLFVDYRFVADNTAFSTEAVKALADETVAPRSARQTLELLWLQKSAFVFIPMVILLATVCLWPDPTRVSTGAVGTTAKPGVHLPTRRGDPLEDRTTAIAALLGTAVCMIAAGVYLAWAGRLPRHVRLPLVHGLAVAVVVICAPHAPAWQRKLRPGRAALFGVASSVGLTLAVSVALLVRDVAANRSDRHVHADIVSRLMADPHAVYYLGNLEYLRTYPPWQAADASGRRLLPPVEFARTPVAAPVIDSLGVPTLVVALGDGNEVILLAKVELVDLLQNHLFAHHGMVRVARFIGAVGEDKPGERARQIVAVRFRQPAP